MCKSTSSAGSVLSCSNCNGRGSIWHVRIHPAGDTSSEGSARADPAQWDGTVRLELGLVVLLKAAE